MLFQPFFGGEIGVYNRRKTTESGADSLNLVLKQRTKNTYSTYLGTHLTTYWNCFVINADIAWQHRYGSTNRNSHNRFNGVSNDFLIKDANLGNNAIRGAFNISKEIYDSVDLYAEISGERWKNWSAYAIDLGIAFWW